MKDFAGRLVRVLLLALIIVFLCVPVYHNGLISQCTICSSELSTVQAIIEKTTGIFGNDSFLVSENQSSDIIPIHLVYDFLTRAPPVYFFI